MSRSVVSVARASKPADGPDRDTSSRQDGRSVTGHDGGDRQSEPALCLMRQVGPEPARDVPGPGGHDDLAGLPAGACFADSRLHWLIRAPCVQAGPDSPRADGTLRALVVRDLCSGWRQRGLAPFPAQPGRDRGEIRWRPAARRPRLRPGSGQRGSATRVLVPADGVTGKRRQAFAVGSPRRVVCRPHRPADRAAGGVSSVRRLIWGSVTGCVMEGPIGCGACWLAA
jgi:hypothetical protein